MSKYVYGGLIVLFIGLVGANVYLFKSLNDTKEQNVVLEHKLNNQQNIISEMQETYSKSLEMQANINNSITDLNSKFRVYQQELNSKTAKLNQTAITRSAMVETRVNNATQRVLNCFENISRGEKCSEY